MNLRPHHLLCIQKYTGHGYDEAFTEHMNRVVSTLRDNPDISFTVTKGCDDLCEMCPNNEGGVCSALEKVSTMDKAVMEICEIDYSERVSWDKYAKTARELIFETDEFRRICSSCEWFNLCKNTAIGIINSNCK